MVKFSSDSRNERLGNEVIAASGSLVLGLVTINIIIITVFTIFTLSAVAENGAAKSSTEVKSEPAAEIYRFREKALDGREIDFSTYKGSVLLIVNTASKCGFTPQYAGLEDLSKKYASRGLRVLGFPCNQFGQQEPGDGATISEFCTKNYGVDFQMFEKIDVNGDKANGLYVYLKKAAPNNNEDIRWNFTKFLVDRTGKIFRRYDSNVKPEEIKADIEKLLQG
jgi:glutathione peroxidase